MILVSPVRLVRWWCLGPVSVALPVALALSSALPATVAAQTELDHTGLAANPDSAMVAALRQIEGEPLRLAEAISAALQNAPQAREAAAGWLAARGTLRKERGVFDPELFAEWTRAGSDVPSASPFAGADVLEQEVTSARAGGRIRSRLGTEIEASLVTSRSGTNSSLAVLDPEVQASGLLALRQPLLRGFGPAARADLGRAEREAAAEESSYLSALLQVRAQVESSYWELFAAERDLAVARLLVDQGQAFLQRAAVRVEAGLAGADETASARVFLAERSLAALDVEERLDGISDRLVTLVGRRPSGPRFRTSDRPPTAFTLAEEDVLLERALDTNRALDAARRRTEAAAASARGARWNALPRLDLVGSLGGNGLSGDPQEVIFGGDTLRTEIDGGFGDAIGDVIGRDFPTWSVGLEFSLPLGLRQNGGEHQRLRAEVERARQQEAAVRNEVERGVRGRYREYLHGRERLDLANDGVEASLEQVRIGVIEYDNGRSTAFELVRLAADVASSQQRLSDALVRTAAAVAELRQLAAVDLAEIDAYRVND